MILDHKKIYRELQPELEKVEEIRLTYSKRIEPFKLAFWSIFILGGSYLFYLINFPNNSIVPYVISYLVLSTVSLILFIWVLIKNRKAYKASFNNQIAPTIVKSLGPDFSYDYQGIVPESDIKKCHLFPKFDRYKSEDLIKGTLEDIPITLAEISLSQLTMINNQPSEVPVFQGFYLRAKLNVNFPIAIWLSSQKNAYISKQGREKLSLKHPLEKRYQVYADDPAVANEVLQPFIIDRIGRINEQLRHRKFLSKKHALSICFDKDTVIIAIPSKKKLMEPKLSRTFDSEGFVASQVRLLNSITQLLTDLALR